MSLIRPSRVNPAPWRFSVSRRWWSSRWVRSSRSVSPITPFIGVRISWLIVARNSDFSRDASIASSRASASSAALRSRSATTPSWCAIWLSRWKEFSSGGTSSASSSTTATTVAVDQHRHRHQAVRRRQSGRSHDRDLAGRPGLLGERGVAEADRPSPVPISRNSGPPSYSWAPSGDPARVLRERRRPRSAAPRAGTWPGWRRSPSAGAGAAGAPTPRPGRRPAPGR